MRFAVLPTSLRTLCTLLAELALIPAVGATQRSPPPAELAHLEKVVLSVQVHPELGGVADEEILERQAALELEERGIRVETASQLRARGLDAFQSTDPSLWIHVSSTFEAGEGKPGTITVELYLQESARVRRGSSGSWSPPVGLSTYRRDRVVPVASRLGACKVALTWVKSLASDFAREVVESTDHDYYYKRGRLPRWWHLRLHDRRHQPIARTVVVPGPAERISDDPPETEACAVAAYTEAGRRAGASGTAVVEVIVDGAGRVASAQLTQDLPHGLGAAALEAARSWRFYPDKEPWRRTQLEFVFERVPRSAAWRNPCPVPLRAVSFDKSLDIEPAAAQSSQPRPEPTAPVVASVQQPCPPPRVSPPLPTEPLFPVSEEVPEAVAYAAPQYTEAGRRARVTGTVLIDVLIGPEGYTVRQDITQALPMGLDNAAIEAAKAWRFGPSKEKRRKATLEFVFALDDQNSQGPQRHRFEAPFRMITWAPAPIPMY